MSFFHRQKILNDRRQNSLSSAARFKLSWVLVWGSLLIFSLSFKKCKTNFKNLFFFEKKTKFFFANLQFFFQPIREPKWKPEFLERYWNFYDVAFFYVFFIFINLRSWAQDNLCDMRFGVLKNTVFQYWPLKL